MYITNFPWSSTLRFISLQCSNAYKIQSEKNACFWNGKLSNPLIKASFAANDIAFKVFFLNYSMVVLIFRNNFMSPAEQEAIQADTIFDYI